MLQRALAVLAAFCLVGAFALATVLPPMTTLAEALDWADHPTLVWLRTAVSNGLSPWVWNNVFVPVLWRPDWLILACVGLVSAGAAMTLGNGGGRKGGVTRSRRRRS